MTRHYLMCRPTTSRLTYAINPWMDPTRRSDRRRWPIRQWEALRDTYLELGPHGRASSTRSPGLPDMVFAANGAPGRRRHACSARSSATRSGPAEGPAYLRWFAEQRVRPVHERRSTSTRARATSSSLGDVHAGRHRLPHRAAAHAEAQEFFGRPVITLQLVDPRYYHLDTALVRRSTDAHVAYFPEAFSPGSQAVLRRLFPDAVIADRRRRRRARPQRGQRRPQRGAARRRPATWPLELPSAGYETDPGRPVRAAQGRRRPEVLHAGARVTG